MPETRKNPETNLDASLHSSQARVTGGLSPLAAYLAWSDWVLHLANAPGKMSDATVNAIRRGLGMELQGAAASPAHVADHRFDHPVWSFWPFAQYAATQQLAEGRLIQSVNANEKIRGISGIRSGWTQWS